MSANRLRDLFVDQLQDVYDAEHRIVEALPRMAKAAISNDLRAAFDNHLEQSREHIHRLERVMQSIDVSPKRKKCKAISGLLDEGQDLMRENEERALDAALIAAAQKVEHYEMATYGCLRTWADVLGHEEASTLLQATLDEEGAADEKLTAISLMLNAEAMKSDERRAMKARDYTGDSGHYPAS